MIGRLIRNYDYDRVATRLYPPGIISGGLVGGVYGAYNSNEYFTDTVFGYCVGTLCGAGIGFFTVALHPLLITGVIPVGMYGYKNYKNYKKM
jgi:hypothetical protein